MKEYSALSTRNNEEKQEVPGGEIDKFLSCDGENGIGAAVRFEKTTLVRGIRRTDVYINRH